MGYRVIVAARTPVGMTMRRPAGIFRTMNMTGSTIFRMNISNF